MNPDLLALAEPLLVFGLLVVFMHWQFRELRQRAEARQRAARDEPSSPDGIGGDGGADPSGPIRADVASHDPPRHPPG